MAFTADAECHRLSMLSSEPNRSQMTLRYSSSVRKRLRMMIG